jgi:prepilin signal peptidase PulO-like enzyme (type II secretory pathway)
MTLLIPIALFVLGAMLGAGANFLIYRERFEPRPISPWMSSDLRPSPRRLLDFVPIFGWLGMRRYAKMFGVGFWIRPLLIELIAAIGTVALYDYEIGGGLLPANFPRPIAGDVLTILQLQFALHLVLLFFMLAASLIDADETIIPDSITMPGTLLGLAMAAFFPRSLLPDFYQDQFFVWHKDMLQIASPESWPASLAGSSGLLIGLGCWLIWCFALLPRTWYSRHGIGRAIRLCCARVLRERFSLMIAILAIFGAAGILFCRHHGGESWIGLLSSLVGMAGGGLIVWLVRILGSAVLKREAMGFGDVTLLAMIGAFLGWQAILIVFFFAPFAAIVVGILRMIFVRDKEIPYGPFLCLAALAVLLGWDTLWARTRDIFALGAIVPLALLVCFLLLPPMLYGLRRTGLFGK